MAILSLVLSALFAVTAVGWRGWAHTRRTGTHPFRGGAGIGAVGALAAGAVAFSAGPLVDLVTGRGRLVHGPVVATLGVVLAALGLAGTSWAQRAMGDAWRIGVDPKERTTLVVNGPFRWVRNPIYSAMIAFAAGLALLVPNVASLLGLALTLIGLEVHVRLVEEPHLTDSFAAAYRTYATRVGRFVPGIGRHS